MASELIPDGDLAFADRARIFAANIAKDPARFGMGPSDVEQINHAVREFVEAFHLAKRPGTKTPIAVTRKNEARKRCEVVLRRYANRIRVDDRVDPIDKRTVYVIDQPAKARKMEVPLAPPHLSYHGTPPKAGPNSGLHLLRFKEGFQMMNRRKPNGATRVEIFVDLVKPGDPIPRFPGEFLGGRPWYLRSYTSSPAKVRHPIPPVPMLVVYWARWADAKGETGPFSQTCISRVEGYAVTGNDKLLGPMPDVRTLASDPKYLTSIEQFRERLLPPPEPEQPKAIEGEVSDEPPAQKPKLLPPESEAA